MHVLTNAEKLIPLRDAASLAESRRLAGMRMVTGTTSPSTRYERISVSPASCSIKSEYVIASHAFKPQYKCINYTPAWEQRKFSELASLRRGLTYSPADIRPYGQGIRVLRSSNIDEDEFTLSNEDVFVDETVVGIELVQEGEILITAANGSPRLVGKRAIINGLTGKTVHGGFMLCAHAEQPDYVAALMGSRWYQHFLATGVAGGNGSIGNLDKAALEDEFAFVPSIEEQELIGVLFSRLDDLITLHQRKYDKLVIFKKSMLEKMFPKDGESVPEIRFAGFTDPWEQRKLVDIAEIVGGGTPDTNNSNYWDGDIDWYAPAELGNNIYAESSTRKITQAGFDSCSTKMLPADKTILFTSRAGIGHTAILRHSACTNQGFQSLVIGDADVYFVYSMSERIKKWAEEKASGSTFLEISGRQLETMPVNLPSLVEQQAIGSFFSHLDDLITLHQRKLELLRNIKKSLLDKMFV